MSRPAGAAPSPLLLWGLVLLGILALTVAVAVIDPRSTPSLDEPEPPKTAAHHPDSAPREPLPNAALQPLAEVLRTAWEGAPVTAGSLPPGLEGAGVVYLNARRGGESQDQIWQASERVGPALIDALHTLRGQVGEDGADTLEVNLGHGLTTLDPRTERRAFTNLYRGLKGLELIRDGEITRFAPTTMISTNRDFKRTIEVWAQRSDELDRPPPDLSVRLFEADQFLVPLQGEGPAIRLYRGNRIIDIDEITAPQAAQLADLQAGWLFENLHPDGRQTYKYWPSSGKESQANNMIRQWMASVAMIRVAHRHTHEEPWEAIDRNIVYNLDQFYEEEGGLGLIVEGGSKVKLGAVALAALALLEHRDPERWRAQEEALYQTTLHLWQDDGSFKTFYRPDRNDNHNFYPGEALLYWASRYDRQPDPALLRRFLKSVAHYREWHLENRNPAFIPWHTQAYVKLWNYTRDPELAAWVFEMNDWLLDVQQWEEQASFPDTMGRFYDPRRPFGPPHSSSTGVYIEGLIDAYKLAKELDEPERAERYRQAIVRALRSIAQLTFKDEVDMFYISKRERVRGGVRTTVYNNEIRVDNVQHNLMGILKVLDTFDAEDFRP